MRLWIVWFGRCGWFGSCLWCGAHTAVCYPSRCSVVSIDREVLHRFFQRKTAAEPCQGWASGGGRASDWRCQGGENRWTQLGWDETLSVPMCHIPSCQRKENKGRVLLVSEQQEKLCDVKWEPKTRERSGGGGPAVSPGELQWRWWALKTELLSAVYQVLIDDFEINRWSITEREKGRNEDIFSNS